MKNKTIIPDKFYDDVIIAKIADKLGIIDKDKIEDLTKILEESAKKFFWNKDFQSRFTKAQTNKKLKQLAIHLRKARILYDEVTENSLSGSGDILSSLIKLRKNHQYGNLLYEEYHKHEYFNTSKKLSSLIEALEIAFHKASTEKAIVPYEKWNKTQLVLSWIWSFDDFWEENSTIAITEGRHTILEAESEKEQKEKSGNESQSMKIMGLMVQPINNYMKGWKITNSKLTQAIRLRRDSGNMVKEIDLSDAAFEELFQ